MNYLLGFILFCLVAVFAGALIAAFVAGNGLKVCLFLVIEVAILRLLAAAGL